MAKIDFKLIEYYCASVEERYAKNLKEAKKAQNKKLIKRIEKEQSESTVWFSRYRILLEYLKENPKADINKLKISDLNDSSTISWLAWYKVNSFKYGTPFYRIHLLAMLGVQIKDERGEAIDYDIPGDTSKKFPRKILSIFRKG